MSDIFPKRVLKDLITDEDSDPVEVNGFEVRGVHTTLHEVHITIYDEDDELIGTLDAGRYTNVRKLWNAVRVQVGLEKEEPGIGDLFG